MKELTEYYDKKTIYEEIYGPEYERNIERDIKRLDKKYYKTFLPYMTPISISLYILFSLAVNTSIDNIIVWSIIITILQAHPNIAAYFEYKRLKDASKDNLKDLTRMLLKKDVEASLDDLSKSVVIKKKEKNKIVLKSINTKEVVSTQKEKKSTKDYYFEDIDSKLRCLREIRNIITVDGNKQIEKELFLLEDQELEADKVMQLKK